MKKTLFIFIGLLAFSFALQAQITKDTIKLSPFEVKDSISEKDSLC